MGKTTSSEFCTCPGRFGQKKHRKTCYKCGPEYFCCKCKGITNKPKKLSECGCDSSFSLAAQSA